MKALLIALSSLLVMCALIALLYNPFSSNESLVRNAYQRLFQGGPQGVEGAVKGFRKALEIDPASPYRWCDLGEALLEARQLEQARYCFGRALDLGGSLPPILMRVANFHFRIQENQRALRCTSRILASIPQYDQVVFSSYTAMGAGVDDVLAYGIPRDGRAAQSYFRYLLPSGETADVEKVWRWIASHSFADDRLAGQYVDFLLRNKQYDKAAEAWALHVGERRGDYLSSNYLFNGEFESEPSGARFDWRISRLDGVEVQRDSNVAHSGNWSLRIRFEGKENLVFRHISQEAPVKPGRYRFRAQVRTEAITTDQGVGFRILDAEAPARLDITTERLVGTSGWKTLQKSFLVPSKTRLLKIRVVRRPSIKFDNKIRGTLWIDAVCLDRPILP